MVAKSFEIGDLVWAKMKGFPPWPGTIMKPPADAKPPKVKKSHHYVLFFGSENYAWIPDENIVLHNDKLVEQYASKKRPSQYISAVETIVSKSKSVKYQKQQQSDTSSDKEDSSVESSPKNKLSSVKSTSVNSVSKKGEMKKKVPMKKLSFVRKVAKKRSLSTDQNGSDSSYILSPSKSRRSDDYSELLASIPPNIGYTSEACKATDDSVLHSTGILSTNAYVERPETPPLDLKSVNEMLMSKNIVPTEKKIGFLGIGKMGRGMIKNLLQSGHSVTIWNMTIEKCDPFVAIGANKVMTPADVIMASDITFCCVSDADASKAIVFGNCGVLKGLEGYSGENKGYVEMTSIDPKTSQAIADEVTLKGGRYLETPLCGSRVQAEEGTLFILGAGSKSLFNDCETCFRAMGRNAYFISPDVGTASKYNIVHSTFLGTVYAALAEALALVDRAGLEQNDFLNILSYGVLNSKPLAEKARLMINNNYTCNTPLKYMQKDLNLALLLGSTVEQPMPITAAGNEVYKHCKLLRYSDHDVSAVYEGTRR